MVLRGTLCMYTVPTESRKRSSAPPRHSAGTVRVPIRALSTRPHLMTGIAGIGGDHATSIYPGTRLVFKRKGTSRCFTRQTRLRCQKDVVPAASSSICINDDASSSRARVYATSMTPIYRLQFPLPPLAQIVAKVNHGRRKTSQGAGASYMAENSRSPLPGFSAR